MNKLFKTILLSFLIAFLLLPSIAFAYVSVKGYFRRSGTYVQPYYRSSPNSYKFDNYSSRGNYNLFTSKKGYKSYLEW